MSIRKVSSVLLLFLTTSSLLLLSACSIPETSNTGDKIEVVAAENFYGDLVRQIGGEAVDLHSILNDPNVDPHEYESTISDAKKVATAKLVIENGGGYDSWMDNLLSGSPNTNRVVLKTFDLAQVKLPENEHVWYSIDNIQALSKTIAENLKQLSPSHSAEFEANYQKLAQQLQDVQTKIITMKQTYNNTPIGVTESIFQYQADALGLKVLTPTELQNAVAEGVDPPAASISEADNQVTQKQIKVLVYNIQNTGAITTRLMQEAKNAQIPVVSITETIPQDTSYQAWMLAQLGALETALQHSSS